MKYVENQLYNSAALCAIVRLIEIQRFLRFLRAFPTLRHFFFSAVSVPPMVLKSTVY